MDQQTQPGQTFTPNDNQKSDNLNQTNQNSNLKETNEMRYSNTPDVNLVSQPGVANQAPQTNNQTSAIPTTMPEFNPPLIQTKRRFSKLKVLLLALVGLLLVGAGSAYGYLGVYLPNTPENIIKYSMKNALEAKSIKYDGEIVVSADNMDSIKIVLNGSTDGTNMSINMSAGLGITSVNLESRIFSDSIYAKLGGLKGLDSLILPFLGDPAYMPQEFPAQLESMIDGINEQWIVFDFSSLIPEGGLPTDLSDEETSSIVDILGKYNLVKITQEYDDEIIEGDSAKHMKVELDKDAIKSALQEFKNANIESLKITDDEYAKAIKSIDALGDNQMPIEIWVSKKDKTLRKISMAFNEGTSNATVAVVFKDYNQPVNIDKPTDAKTIMEMMDVFAPLMQNFSGSDGSVDLPSLLNDTENPQSELIPSVMGAFRSLNP